MKKIIQTGLFFICMNMIFMCPNVLAQNIIVIGNQSVPEASVDNEWVKNVYLGNITKWSNNDPIVLSVINDNDIHSKFLKKYLNRKPSQFTAIWRNMMFTGKGKMPKTLDSKQEMLDFVANNKGAVGYIVSGVNTETIKIINRN